MRFLKIFSGIFLFLVIGYLLGPRPSKPQLSPDIQVLKDDLNNLEKEINTSEKKVKNLKKDNQARIIWADSAKKQKTSYSVVYLHGFSASSAEGAPVHQNFAQRYGFNLYLSRLEGHGIKDKEIFTKITPENLLESAKKAVAIGEQLGDSVIVIGTSTGASLGIYLASGNPKISAVIAYSPLIDFYPTAMALLDKPWGLQIARLAMGGEYNKVSNLSEKRKKYWTEEYRLEGAVSLKSLIVNTMQEEVFKKIKQPFFLAYYYKDEEHQDQTVSVKAMQEMYQALGTSKQLKREIAFPKAGHHVIASPLTSKDWESVQKETYRFAEEVLHLKPKLNITN